MSFKIAIITQGFNPAIKSLALGDYTPSVVFECPPSRELAPIKSGILRYGSRIRATFTGIYTNELSEFCKIHSIQYLRLPDEPRIFGSLLERYEIDLVVVYSMSRLIPESCLRVPRYGFLNIHPSLLPKYRGPNPLFWHFYDNATGGGVTIHQLSRNSDQGAIFAQETISISRGESIEALGVRLAHLGVNLLLKTLPEYLSGAIEPISQPKKSPTRYARRIKWNEDVIRWDEWDVERVWHFLAGTSRVGAPFGLSPLTRQPIRYDVLGFKQGACDSYRIGKVYRTSAGIFVRAKDGLVHLSDRS